MTVVTFAKQCNPRALGAELARAGVRYRSIRTTPTQTIVECDDAAAACDAIKAHVYAPLELRGRARLRAARELELAGEPKGTASPPAPRRPAGELELGSAVRRELESPSAPDTVPPPRPRLDPKKKR